MRGASSTELTTCDKQAITVWNEHLILRGGLQWRGVVDTNTCWKWSIQEENWMHFLGNAQTLHVFCCWKLWELCIELSLTCTKKYHSVVLTSLWVAFLGSGNSSSKHTLTSTFISDAMLVTEARKANDTALKVLKRDQDIKQWLWCVIIFNQETHDCARN